MAAQTYYDLLDVPANAPAERIRESYHVIASIWHPDRFPRGSKQHQLATRKLREINAAYEVLRDPQRRSQYDHRLLEERRVSGIYWSLRAQGHYGPPTGFTNLPALFTYALGLITGILFLLLPPYRRDRLVRFHAWQATLLGGVVYLAILLGPLVGLQRPIYWVLWMTGYLFYSVFLMKRAYYNQYYLIPLLGEIAARWAGVDRAEYAEFKAEGSE